MNKNIPEVLWQGIAIVILCFFGGIALMMWADCQ